MFVASDIVVKNCHEKKITPAPSRYVTQSHVMRELRPVFEHFDFVGQMNSLKHRDGIFGIVDSSTRMIKRKSELQRIFLIKLST